MTVTTEQVSNDIKPGYSFPPLLLADRSCAYSSAQALVRVANSRGTDLLLDGHAYRRHGLALLAAGWEVIEDVREAVLNPSQSALDTSDH
jgi:hypothetical protein